MIPAAPETIGPYRVTGVIGAGGMGAVYRGVRGDGDEAVAIKTVSAAREPWIPAIRREIHALGRLRHPGIVRFLDSGTERGIPWYAMELAPPRSLADLREELWSKGSPAPGALRDLLTIVRRLCAPLAYLHGEGMIHGDIKPSNVLLRADGQPVLIDFGLLTTLASEPGRDAIETRHHVAGTVEYMAPEQIEGGQVDARADLYAIGCVLYELSTGRPPFDDGRVEDVLRAHRERPPVPPSALGAPRDLDDLVLRLLAKNARDRIGHAEDVAARLAALGAGAPIGDRGPRPRAYLYRPGLAGRSPSVDALAADMASRFGASKGGMAFVVGESGVGKTRFAIEISRRAEALGARVLSGGCVQLAGALHALARPLQAIADRCRAEGAKETERLLGARCKLLARYEPQLASLPGAEAYPDPPDLPAEAVRALVSHELSVTFEALAGDRPLLLVIDDLQWADDLTLAFLARLAALETLSRSRLFVLGTARSEEMSGALGELSAAPFAQRIDLDRLDEQAVGAMVSDMLAMPSPGEAFVRFIARHTEGNPFFVAEYLRASVNEGLLLRDENGRWQLVGDDEASLASLPLPRTLRDLVAGRLGGLGEGARRVADLAAVIGREIDPALLAGVAAIGDAEWTQVTSELVTRQVFEDTGSGLRFSHDKIREVAHDRLGDARAALHRAVAGALDARLGARSVAQGAIEAAAHHWLEAGDEAKAAPLVLAAADRSLAVCDNERAHAGYGRALSILDGRNAARDRAVSHELFTRRALWEDLADPGAAEISSDVAALREAMRKAHRGRGDALTATGRYDEALVDYESASRHAAGAEARADALGRMAAVRFAKGELLAAAECSKDALRHLGDVLPETRAGVIASIGGRALVLAARLVRGRQLDGDRARAVERLRVKVLNRLTYINYSFSIERCVQTHLYALAAAERISSTKEAAETFSHHGPLFAGFLPASARVYARRAVAVCRREGHLDAQMQAEFMAGMSFVFLARWGEAVSHFRTVIDLHAKLGDIHTLQTARENLSYALLYRGDHEDALTESRTALEMAERVGDVRGVSTAGCHMGLAVLRLGDQERARRVAEEAAASLAALDDHVVHCMVHALLGRVARAGGQPAEARTALERAVAIADEHGLVQEEVASAYTELLDLHADMGAVPPEESARILRKARTLGGRFPAHEGPTLRAEARLLHRKGRAREARRALTRAIDVLTDLGMRHDLGRTWEVKASFERGRERTIALDRALHLYRETRARADARRVEAALAERA